MGPMNSSKNKLNSKKKRLFKPIPDATLMCFIFRIMLRVLQILQIDVSQIIDTEFKFYLLIIELASSHIICHVLIICSKMYSNFSFFFFNNKNLFVFEYYDIARKTYDLTDHLMHCYKDMCGLRLTQLIKPIFVK